MIEIRIAAESEKPGLLDLLIEKSARLRAEGRPLWDPREFTLERIDLKYGRPEYVVGTEDGGLFGGLLLPDADPAFWPEKKSSAAFYVHKLVVKTEFAGRGLATLLLEWAKEYARSRGKDYLRLDYDHTREYLNGLYRRAGFEAVDRVVMENGRSLTRAAAKLA